MPAPAPDTDTHTDTIIALASAPPPAPRIVFRLSGPAALPAAQSLTLRDLHPGPLETPIHLPGLTGILPIPATLWSFRAPRSYTGEDTVELHLPGSPWITTQTLRHLLAQPGVRMATPGEFTARAYFAGKMDLTAAEGVALAVSAADTRQLQAARQLLAGTLAGKVRALSESLATLLALLEAGIDFTDEDVSFISPQDLRSGIGALSAEIATVLAAGAKFNARGLTPTIALVGRPNAGKSSLFNALLGHQRVIVSPQAGTTRDAIYADLQLPRGTAQLIDLAGLDDLRPTDDLSQAMHSKALQTLATADVLLHLIDGTTHNIVHDTDNDTIPPHTLPRTPDLTLYTKSDLPAFHAPPNAQTLSTTTGAGLPALRTALDHLLFSHEGGHALALNSRHTAHLQSALTALASADEAIGAGDELVASALRQALDALGEITGVISPDDVLGKVFSTFCIGK